jgi:hypothetical protein
MAKGLAETTPRNFGIGPERRTEITKDIGKRERDNA